MAENAIQTVQLFLQDVLAPDVRELKVELAAQRENTDLRFDALRRDIDLRFQAVDQKFAAMGHKIDLRFESVDQKFMALEHKMDLRFDALGQRIELLHNILLANMKEWRARTELSNLTFKSEIGERLAALETKRQSS